MTTSLDRSVDPSVDTAPLTRDEMVARVRELGPAFTERAVRYDRDAVFPWENFADLEEAGLLALCVPRVHGGLGASYADYARVSAPCTSTVSPACTSPRSARANWAVR